VASVEKWKELFNKQEIVHEDGAKQQREAGPRRRAFPGGAWEREDDFVPVCNDHQRLAAEMRGERLPEEFVETILSG
jgi:hypothetical protein